MRKDALNNIRAALSDPHAPWYGSDLVEWVAELLDEFETMKANNLKEYPQWVCTDCGLAANTKRFDVSTYHHGTCGVCGKQTAVTEPRDFYYPEFEGFEKP